MKVRFLADADLNKAIVTGVLRREPLVDFLTASSVLRGMKAAVLAGKRHLFAGFIERKGLTPSLSGILLKSFGWKKLLVARAPAIGVY